MTIMEDEITVLQQLIATLIKECTDATLLDLIYKLLIVEGIQQGGA